MKRFTTTCDRCGAVKDQDHPASTTTGFETGIQTEVTFRPAHSSEAWGVVAPPKGQYLDVCPPCLAAYHSEQRAAFVRWMETK